MAFGRGGPVEGAKRPRGPAPGECHRGRRECGCKPLARSSCLPYEPQPLQMPNLKYAFRTLLKSPFVSGIAILSLALGIGANSAIFSLFNEMLLKPLPVTEPARLVNFGDPGPQPGSNSCGQAGDCDEVFSYQMFQDLQKAPTAFTGIAAHVLFGANVAYNGVTVNGDGPASLRLLLSRPGRAAHAWPAARASRRHADRPELRRGRELRVLAVAARWGPDHRRQEHHHQRQIVQRDRRRRPARIRGHHARRDALSVRADVDARRNADLERPRSHQA